MPSPRRDHAAVARNPPVTCLHPVLPALGAEPGSAPSYGTAPGQPATSSEESLAVRRPPDRFLFKACQHLAFFSSSSSWGNLLLFLTPLRIRRAQLRTRRASVPTRRMPRRPELGELALDAVAALALGTAELGSQRENLFSINCKFFIEAFLICTKETLARPWDW